LLAGGGLPDGAAPLPQPGGDQGADARLVVGDDDTRLMSGGTAVHSAHLGHEAACGGRRERGKNRRRGRFALPAPADDGDAEKRSSVGRNETGGPNRTKRRRIFRLPSTHSS